MKKLMLSVLVIILLTACFDPEGEDPNDFDCGNEYVCGQVVVGLHDSISTEFYTRYIYDLDNIEIGRIGYTYYYAPYDSGMVQEFNDLLASKSYVIEQIDNVRYVESEDRILLFIRFQDFGLDDLEDWLDFCEEYSIVREQLRNYMLLSVQYGTEEDWVTFFEQNEYFRYAELNYIITIQ